MLTDELEQLLEARSETPTIEFKGPCWWTVETYAKDLLAMANLTNGGLIIIGVDDATFMRRGVTPEQRDSYDIDTMRDQMTRFADPHVQFEAEVATDRGGLEYVVIRVHPFQEIPVICRVDSAGTRAGAVYYRSANRRPESAPVSNSYDMRTIITLAAARTRAHLDGVGFRAVSEDRRYDEELEGV